MSASLKIVNPPAGSKQAGQGPEVNRPCQAGPSNTADKRAAPGHTKNSMDRVEPGLKI